MTGKIITLAELVEILDVSPKAVRDMLISPSFPIHEKGRRGKSHLFDTAAVINWLKERERKRAAEKPDKSELAELKARAAAAVAQRREIELAERTGALVDFRLLMPFIKDKLVIFRQMLYQIPPEMREQFGGEAGAFCEKRIRETLNHLAGGGGIGGIEEHACDIAKPR